MALDRSLVSSGFDTETVVSEGYLAHLLLAQIEAGRLSLALTFTDESTGEAVEIAIHPPAEYVRLYEPAPGAPLPPAQAGSFTLTLLPQGEGAFMHLFVWASVVAADTGELGEPNPVGLLIDLALEREETDAGLERGHALRLSLVGLDPTTAAGLVLLGLDPAAVESAVREQLDRTVSLGVARGQEVQRIRMRKHLAEGQRSLAFLVDLALRSGPDPGAYVAPRGDPDLATDFRPPHAPIAFATSPGLLDLLGPDARYRQAEPSGSGFRYPLRRDPLDPESDEIGRIKDIDVFPQLAGLPPEPTGRLVIDVHGEYTDALLDPDFHLRLTFSPVLDDAGAITWDLDVDVDLGLLASLLLVAGGIGLTLLFAPALEWGSTLLVGTIVGLAALKGLIAEPLAAKLVEDRLGEGGQASILDALPFRLRAARRRWDPFYATEHEVVALLAEPVTIDDGGISFVGSSAVLGRQPLPVSHVVVREKYQVGSIPNGLRYRVSDFEDLDDDLAALALGTDRRPYTRDEPVLEPTLVTLENAQIRDRIDSRRLRAPITCTAERANIAEGQIAHLLCLSRQEKGELRTELVGAFRARSREALLGAFGDQLRDQVTEDLAKELGRPPTPDEVEAEVAVRLRALVDALMPEYEKLILPGELADAVAAILSFELPPERLVSYQRAGVLILDGKEIITREADGVRTPYYRDRPDRDAADNLLSLPRYEPPYRPPA